MNRPENRLHAVSYPALKSIAVFFGFSGLARAAVEGDERALDMFSSWRPKTAGQRRMSLANEPKEHLACFVGSLSGEKIAHK
jgi:hypothetical protein